MQLPFVSRNKYDEVVYKLECLLCHVTGNKLSKAGYDLRVMESWANNYLDECIEEALSEAEETHRWIPVEERLPNEGEDVLAFCYYHEAYQPLVCYLSPVYKGRWITSVAGQWVQVTHWMPLPEPPKGEK